MTGDPDTCRDHRCLTICQKQHRQNELAGQVDIPTRVEVHVIGTTGTCQKQHRHSWSGRHSYQGGSSCDVSLPVKNNTDSMNQLVR